MAFGENLKRIREANGMTQKELADKLCLTPPSIVSYETGNKKPSFDVLMGITRELNASLDELCDNKKQFKSWSDAMKVIASLAKCWRYVEFKIQEDGVPAIIFESFVHTQQPISKHDSEIFIATEDILPHANFGEYGYRLNTRKNYLERFVIEFTNMKNLYDDGSIDEELLQLWLDKTYKKYSFDIDFPVPPIPKEDFDEITEDDDLPF